MTSPAWALGLVLIATLSPFAVSDPAGEPRVDPSEPAGVAPPVVDGRVPASELKSLVRHDDVVVRQVGEVEIRASDVFRVLDLAAPALAADVLREMVLTTLAEQEARREGVDVPASELEGSVDEAMAEQRARFALEGAPDMSLEEFLLEFHGMTAEEYQSETRRMVLASLLLDRVVRLQQFRSTRDELQIILVSEKELADEIHQLLGEGASFSVLAKRHSEHPSGTSGGFMPALSQEVSAPVVDGREMLSPGEVLGPAPITLGEQDFWRFLRLVDRHEAMEGDWDGLRDLVEADLIENPMNPDEVAIFEARMREEYRVRQPARDS